MFRIKKGLFALICLITVGFVLEAQNLCQYDSTLPMGNSACQEIGNFSYIDLFSNAIDDLIQEFENAGDDIQKENLARCIADLFKTKALLIFPINEKEYSLALNSCPCDKEILRGILTSDLSFWSTLRSKNTYYQYAQDYIRKEDMNEAELNARKSFKNSKILFQEEIRAKQTLGEIYYLKYYDWMDKVEDFNIEILPELKEQKVKDELITNFDSKDVAIPFPDKQEYDTEEKIIIAPGPFTNHEVNLTDIIETLPESKEQETKDEKYELIANFDSKDVAIPFSDKQKYDTEEIIIIAPEPFSNHEVNSTDVNKTITANVKCQEGDIDKLTSEITTFFNAKDYSAYAALYDTHANRI